MVVVWGVLLILLTPWQDASGFVKYNPPRIYPSSPSGDIITTPGSTFQLRCESKEPVHWNYTQNNKLESRVKIKSWENPHEEYPYVSNITIRNVEFQDVGFYYCAQDGFNSFEQVEKVGKVYVYVNDSKHLLVNTESFGLLTVPHHDSVVIPCRPTSPDVNISLVFNSQEAVDPSPDNFVEYDPKIGFTIRNAIIARHTGLYECVATYNTAQQTASWEVIVLRDAQVIPKPYINDTLASPAILGRNISLECTIYMELGVFFEFSWDIPNAEAIMNGHATVHNEPLLSKYINGIEHRMASTTLKIHDVVLEDEGYYICTVKSHSNRKNNETKFIEVIEQNATYLELTAEIPVIETKAGVDSIQWVIKKYAYPEPEMLWFDPEKKEIKSSAKYEIRNDKKQIVLKINRIVLNDAGQYMLKAVTKQKQQTLNLTLVVEDRPALGIEGGNQYFMYNKMYTLNCTIYAYPHPDTTWLFRNCTEFDDCIGDFTKIDEKNAPVSCGLQCTRKSLTIKALNSGQITCHSNNSNGVDSETISFFVTDVENGFAVQGPIKPVAGDNVTLFCGASVYNYTGDIRWFVEQRGHFYELKNRTEIQIVDTSTQFSYQKKLIIMNIGIKDSGTYRCRVPKMINDGEEVEDILQIEVQAVVKPKFIKTNLNGTDIRVKMGNQQDIICKVTGVPPPKVIWYRNGKLFKIAEQDRNRIAMLENGQVIAIQYFTPDDAGTYECKVTNRGGTTVRTASVYVDEQTKLAMILIAVFAGVGGVLCFCIIIVILYIWRKSVSDRKWRAELAASFAESENGCIESINPEIPVDDQAELLPYNKKWEFPRDRLKLGKQLGAGAFGRVLKAEAAGILEGEALTTVAVKMVKPHAELSYVRALMSELKIMIHLGKHLNVVNLLGACTRDLRKCELMVIVEYCRFGNIQNYLLRHREEFINQVDPLTGYINTKIGADVLASLEAAHRKEMEVAEGPKLNYASLVLSMSPRNEADYRGNDSAGSSDYNGGLSQVTTQTLVSMSPSGGQEEIVLDSSCSTSSNSSGSQPVWRNNYRGDYKGADVRPISTTDLLCWAFQIARGMEYLASRKVLHRDLAARNILLAEDNVVKICDFGLAKEMYKSDNYKKKGEGLLPVKWMAIESIQDRVFSTQSDVWSFGIVMWELFSLGKTPYPGMEPDEKLYHKLMAGYRMDKPKYATADLYKIMLDCWEADPNQRPNFSLLTGSLGDLLEESTKEHYLNLNKPYIAMNEQWQVQNPDYLGMMVSPDYANVARQTTPDRQYMNVPVLGPDGYLLMNTNGSPVSKVMDTSSLANEEDGALQPRTDGSGYLWMKSTDPPKEESGSDLDIFSPRPAKVNGAVGKFSFEGQGVRVREPERLQHPDSDEEESTKRLLSVTSQDSGTVSPNGFFNPTYRSLTMPNGTNSKNGSDYVNMPVITEEEKSSCGKERQDSGNGSNMSVKSDDSCVFISDGEKDTNVAVKGFRSPPPSYNCIVNGIGDQYKL